MQNQFTAPSFAPEFKFQPSFINNTYEGAMTMTTTIQMTEEEFDLNLLNQNLAARFSIQQSCPPTVKIIDMDADSNQWLETCNACHEAAVTSKGDLIELLFELREAGDYDSIKCHLDVYWIADLVSGKNWTEKIHKHYFENYHNFDLYDLNPSEFGSNIHKCYCEFYPLN